MIVLTQNLLVSPMAGASEGAALGIEATEVETKEREYDAEFLKRMIQRIDWPSFAAAAKTLEVSEGIPATRDALDEEDDATMRKVHHALLEVNVVTGNLVCTETSRKFPIALGIPNMLLNQDEI